MFKNVLGWRLSCHVDDAASCIGDNDRRRGEGSQGTATGEDGGGKNTFQVSTHAAATAPHAPVEYSRRPTLFSKVRRQSKVTMDKCTVFSEKMKARFREESQKARSRNLLAESCTYSNRVTHESLEQLRHNEGF